MTNYYEINADKYIEDTIECDMNVQYEFFLKYMPKQGKILDIGFGSGRDMMYFESVGYTVCGIDPTVSFVDRMKDKGYSVEVMYSEDLNYMNEMDGIWACASLLHVKRVNISSVMKKCYEALKTGGIMYCSFKYGNYEVERNGRYFNYLDEESFKEVIKDTGFTIIDKSITGDVRTDRASEQWLNVVMKK